MFVFLQRRQFHQRPFRIRPMHGLAVMAEGFLREAFGVFNQIARLLRKSGSFYTQNRTLQNPTQYFNIVAGFHTLDIA